MFDTLSDKLQSALGDLRKKGRLDDESVTRAMREIRLALLEADVNLDVVKGFVEAIRSQALGQEVLGSLTPAQQIVKIVHEQLIALMGESTPLDLGAAPPVAVMLVGLQGSGKTTTVAKLARYLKNELKRTPYLVPADVRRPAAIEQLRILGE